MTVKKRFIAGAVCPRCGEMDKIVMFQQGEKSTRECVACGFSDTMRYEVAVNPPDTRLDKTREAVSAKEQPEDDAEIVRIVEL